MRKRALILWLLPILLLTACSAKSALYETADDRFSAQYENFSGSRAFAITVPEGKSAVARVETEIQKGSLALQIGQNGQTPAYEGSQLPTGGFTVTLREAGVYVVSVESRDATGSLTVTWQVE